MHRLQALALRIAVRHDARAGAHGEGVPLDAGGADGDGQVHVAAEAHVTHGAAVRSPGGGFQFRDDLHGPDLGCAGKGAGREGSPDQLPGVAVRPQVADNVGDQMHHVAVALHEHQVRHLHGAGFGHPAQVVASQVHQHEMFGALLLVHQQLVGQGPVFLFVAAPRPGAGDGTQGGDPVFQADHGLGRRADQDELVQVHEEEIGRRIDVALGPVKGPGVGRRRAGERLADDRLDDVAGPDVVLDPRDPLAERLLRQHRCQMPGR